MTKLTRPSLDLYSSWAECVEEFEPGSIPAVAAWLVDRELEVSRGWCAELVRATQAIADTTRPTADGIVRADSYWVTEGECVVGFVQVRHGLNDHLRETGGHIGYSIRPTRRRRGHATRALRLALDRARVVGLDRVLVTCDDDNVASVRTIESAGGVLEDVRAGTRRYWISL